jgi:hypothetical protein
LQRRRGDWVKGLSLLLLLWLLSGIGVILVSSRGVKYL